MRKHQILFFLLLLVQFTFAQKPDINFIEKQFQLEKTSFLKKASFIENEKYTANDLIYQRLEFEIDPNIRFIKGKVTSHFKSNIRELNEIEFDIHSSLTVDSVLHNKQKLNFERKQNAIHIILPAILDSLEIDSLSVFYRGEPANSGFGAFTKSNHNGTPIIWTLSEPYGALEWWPCKQSLVDKIDSIDIIVTSPETYRTASNGVLVSEIVKEGKRTMFWKHRYPIATYLVAIACTNYEDYSDTLFLKNGNHIEIQNFVYPENITDAKTKTPVTKNIMALYNEIIGEYPFASEKYGHAQFGWGGGMEHQTISFMGGFSYELIAHELAHQWFGDYITLGTWQDIWLNEGFATYLTGISYEHLLDGVWWPRWKELNKNRIISEPGGSVFATDTTQVSQLFSGRLSYSKGAYLLHMLRWIMGDESFFAGIKSYFNDPNLANGFAQNHEFIKHMEIAGDTSLTEFFNDWYYGEGFPVYSANYIQLNNNNLQIDLSQTSSHPSVAFFEMPVQIRAYNSNKTDSADFRLIHTENNQRFFINPNFKISEIKIDPENWLISKTAEIVRSDFIESNNKLIVFPNPFSDVVSVYLPNREKAIALKLYSENGQLVQTLNSDKTTFNLSELSPGLYFLQAKTQRMVLQQKIIKH